MPPKSKKDSQIAQRVLVRTLNAIPLGYFAVSERHLSFSSQNSQIFQQKTARHFERNRWANA
jgi:hypothetical protein